MYLYFPAIYVMAFVSLWFLHTMAYRIKIWDIANFTKNINFVKCLSKLFHQVHNKIIYFLHLKCHGRKILLKILTSTGNSRRRRRVKSKNWRSLDRDSPNNAISEVLDLDDKLWYVLYHPNVQFLNILNELILYYFMKRVFFNQHVFH